MPVKTRWASLDCGLNSLRFGGAMGKKDDPQAS
jgi:hypothetical protein